MSVVGWPVNPPPLLQTHFKPTSNASQTHLKRASNLQKVEKKQCRKSGYIYIYMLIYLHIPPYTSIYFHIPPNSFIYLHIPSHTSKYWIIGIMRANKRPQNCHNSGPRAFPMARIWHAPSYHTHKGFSMPKGGQNQLIWAVLNIFRGGHKSA